MQDCGAEGRIVETGKLIRIALYAVAAWALAGCGNMTRLAYNNGEIALRMMANDYFDLDGEQADDFRGRLARFHAWHRSAELPHYASLFGAAGERIERGLAPADVTWAIQSVRTRYGILAAQAIEDSAPLLARMTPDNLRALDKKFAENNAKLYKETMTGDERKRTENRVKGIRKRFEEYLGDLTPEQEARLVAYVRSSPRYTPQRFEERKARQQQFIKIVRDNHGAAPAMAVKLRGFFDDLERDRDSEARLTQLIVDMDRGLSAKQREHAAQRFQKFASEFRVLAGVQTGDRSAVAKDGPQDAPQSASPARPGV